ncbi:MAG: IS4 family transposase [Fusobacteriaceae bacterium]
MESKCLKFLLNESEINKIAKEVGLCTRIRKFTPMELLKMAVFSSNNIAKDILSDISHNIFETSDISVSCEALNKRLNSKFVKFLKAIFSKLLDMGLNIENSDKTTKSSFNRILLTDSSICKLHNSLKKEYPGGRNGECAYAGLKIHFIKDLKNSSPVDIEISTGTKNDFKFLPRLKKILRKNDLVLNDLGYYSLDFFQYIMKKKAYFVSKLKLNSTKTLFIENPNPIFFKTGNIKPSSKYLAIELEEICNSMGSGETKEIENVYIGSSPDKVKCRLIITRLDGDLHERRLNTVTKKIRDPRPYLREEKRDIAKFGFMISNLPKDDYPKEQIYPIYSLRWQIELDFKNWKSILEIDESTRKLKKERIESHFYGKLIHILVNSEISNILKNEIDDNDIVLSEKKIFQKISYYLKYFHRYGYKISTVLEKLYILVPKTCLKSRMKVVPCPMKY